MKMAASLTSLQILAVAAADGSLSLTFVPKIKEGSDPKLATAFTLKGTPEELETDLGAHLEAIQASRETLAETADAVKAVLAQATKDAAAKAIEKKAAKVKATPTGAATTAAQTQSGTAESGDEDEDHEEDGVDSSPTAAASATASTHTAPAAAELNLFA